MTETFALDPSRRALIVDDDPRWRAIVAEIVSQQGWDITAVAAPPDEMNGYDLAVLDVSLGGSARANQDGLKIMEHLTALGTPCVLLSGLSSADAIVAAERQPRVLDYIPKDAFQRDRLIHWLNRVTALPIVQPPSVLIVEDEEHWRALYAEMLDDTGYTLHMAASYAEARSWLQRDELALAIVDLHLLSSFAPDDNLDGFRFLRAASQRHLPTIVVSALGEPEAIDRAYEEYGVFAFVEKERFDRRAFLRTVEDALRARARDAHSAPAATTTEATDLPDSDAARLLSDLTERERDVLLQLAQGFTNREISEQLGITPNTVKKHVDHILQKLQVSNRAGAVAVAMRARLS